MSRVLLYCVAAVSVVAGFLLLLGGAKQSRGEAFLRGYAAAVDSVRAIPVSRITIYPDRPMLEPQWALTGRLPVLLPMLASDGDSMLFNADGWTVGVRTIESGRSYRVTIR